MIQLGEPGFELRGSITNTVREPSPANEHREADHLSRGLLVRKGAAEERDTGDRHPKPDESPRARQLIEQSV
jgi:hypothetical protein